MTEAAPVPTRLLLVDDDPAVVQPLATFFRGRGYTTDVACDLELAQALLEYRHYHAAVLDLCLSRWGGGQGLDLLQQIRHRTRWTSIVVLTGHYDDDTASEARRLGADAVLPKPQRLCELADLISDLIATHS